MLPDYPVLKRRLKEKFEAMVSEKIQENPLLSKMQRTVVHEGNTFTVTSYEGYSTKSEYEEFASGFNIDVNTIIEKGLYAFYEKVPSISKDMADKMEHQTINTMKKVTEATGNVVASKDGITPNSILDAIEKMEIGFDESGNPIMPTILMSPHDFEVIKSKEKEWEAQAPAIEARRKEIIEKKRKEWVDRESHRKLVD
jgi:hypothetical protein